MLVGYRLSCCLHHALFVVIEVLRSFLSCSMLSWLCSWCGALLLYFAFPFFRLSSVPVARCSLASVLRYQSRAPTWQVFCRSWAARMAGAFDSCNGVCRCLMRFVVCQCPRCSMSLRGCSWLVYFGSLHNFPFMVLLAVISCHSDAGCGSVLMLRHCFVAK